MLIVFNTVYKTVDTRLKSFYRADKMNIQHNPIFDRDAIIDFYSEQDGVPIKYVCTSALDNEAFAMDIFYRETPHPKFGNRYFGIYSKPDLSGNNEAMVMIANADSIEDTSFAMVEDFHGNLEYSQHRHDFRMLDNGKMIDGGRAYVRSKGLLNNFKIKDGEFVSE
jgi:hypothetical protein